TGATINRQAPPGIDYLMSAEGGGKRKFYLLGSDYVYPRTTNKILRLYLTKVKKVPESAIAEEYTPFHHQDYQTIVGKIKSFSAAGDAAVINTINGDSNVPFFKELANQGVTADTTPTMSYSFAEVELQTLDVKPLVGHLASWNYFMSLKTPENLKWVKAYKEWAKAHNIPDKQAVTDDPMMHAYIHVHLWAKAAVWVIPGLGGLAAAGPGALDLEAVARRLAAPATQKATLGELAGSSDPAVERLLRALKDGALYSWKGRLVLLGDDGGLTDVAGRPVLDAEQQPAQLESGQEAVALEEAHFGLVQRILERFEVFGKDPAKRQSAAFKLGTSGD